MEREKKALLTHYILSLENLHRGLGPAIALVIMVALGYVEANEGSQTFEVAIRMRYLVASLYTFSALLQYVGLGLIYNLDKRIYPK